MNLIRSTCDRCYAAKTRCTKDASTNQCQKCLRSGAVCKYSPRGHAGRPLGRGTNQSNSPQQPAPAPAPTTDEPFTTLPTAFASNLDLFNNLHSDDNTAAYFWDHPPLLEDYGHSYLPIDEPTHTGPLATPTTSSNAALDLFSALGGGSSHPSSNGAHHDTNSSSGTYHDTNSSNGTHNDTHSSSEATSAAASVKSDSLHGRLVGTHAELIALSESLAVSFSLTDDMDIIYRLSNDMTEILQRLRDNGQCYPPAPIAKCHGMTSLLILGCYSYLLEAYEFTMEKLRHELQDTGGPTDMQQRSASPEDSPQITIGGIRLHVSRKSAAEIHLQLVSQTAQNLRESLRQFVMHTAAPRCSMDMEIDESPASSSAGGSTAETSRGDTIGNLTKMAQRELRRREDGIFQYINESAAKGTR
ncbi:unnamed protein product [Penicillium olsonii]|nr:unnamed protein product [Penicillium olsonii]